MPPFLRYAGKLALRRAFELAQRHGVDVLPHHYYSEIPAITELRSSTAWRAARSMTGIQGTDLAEQLMFAADCCSPAHVARLGSGTAAYDRACQANGAVGYGPIEGLFLYCFVASRRPAKIIQVGAGVSTSLILRASLDADHVAHVVCVDPHPTALLTQLAIRSEIDLIARPAQSLSPDCLTALEPGDLLFIDSTHTVKPGSEVNKIVLDVLPRLKPGVFVHFHDIFFPFDYSPTLLTTDLFFWNETALVQAYLTQNPRARIRVSLSMLHHGAPADLGRLLPAYHPAQFRDGLRQSETARTHFPAALYLETQ